MGGLVWLASYPKSGNTWTRHFLHSLIQGGDKPHDINRMNLLTTGDSAKTWYEPLLGKKISEADETEIAAVRPQAVRAIAAAADGLVFVKTHNAMVQHNGTPMIEPSVTAGAIYIVRNPLDVAISYSHFMAASIDHAIGAMNADGATTPGSEKQVYQYFGSWTENVFSWTRRPIRQLHVMRYEDMLHQPLATFGKLAEFLRLTPTRRELTAAIDASSFEKLKAQEEEEGFREKPEKAERFFREGRAEQWREVLTPAQVDAVVAGCREQMERFGYMPK